MIIILDSNDDDENDSNLMIILYACIFSNLLLNNQVITSPEVYSFDNVEIDPNQTMRTYLLIFYCHANKF